MPLTPQTAFTLQSGEPVCRPPEAGGFPKGATLWPLPVSDAPLRTPIATRGLPVRSAHQGILHVLVPVAVLTFSVTGSPALAKTISRVQRYSKRGWFLDPAAAAAASPPSASRPVRSLESGANRPGDVGEICLGQPPAEAERYPRSQVTSCP